MSRSPILLALSLLLAAGAGAEDTPPISKLLESSLPEKREQAAGLLGEQGDTAAAKDLLPLLKDSDWGVRMAAIRALGPIRFEPGRDALVDQALSGETHGIRRLAARVLAEHDARNSAARIARYLKRLKKEARLPAIEALGFLGTDEGVAALAKQMRAPEEEHRAEAALALGRLRTGEEALQRGLKDKEDLVRFCSAVSLAYVDTDGAREALLDHVAKERELEDYMTRRIGQRGAAANREAFTAAVQARLERRGDPDPYLRIAWYGRLAGCAMAARQHLKARDPLTRVFAFGCAGLGGEPLSWEDAKPGIAHRDGRVRQAAANAYLDTAGDGLTEAIHQVLMAREGDAVMVGVRKAVSVRHRAALDDLAAVAAGKTPAKRDWMARVAACVAIGRIAQRDGFAALEPFAGARQWWLKAAALEGFFHTYRKEVVPYLIDAFDDRHPVVRMTARKNLRYMTGKRWQRKSMYVDYWEKYGDKVEFSHPDVQIKKLDKYGYDTRKYIQEVLKGTDIVVILGKWDKVELVLRDLEVSHNAVRAQEVKVQGLSPKQVVLVNCEGSVDSDTAAYLQWFVVAGGYMATTDWALMNALTRTFPHVVGGYVKQSTGNDVVIAEAATPGHPLLQDVFREGVAHKWWLEIQAFPLTIEDPVRGTVLVDSLEMLLRYGSSAMMAEFPAGLGKVLHSTSHFYLQKEGFASQSDPLERKIFAADHLGLSMKEIRELDSKGVFHNVNDTTPISRSYSMFHLLVNFIDEKRLIDRTR